MSIRRTTILLAVGALALGLCAGDAFANYFHHPHLRAADANAAAAIHQMQIAHNGDDWFGGHRVRAIQLMQEAREQIHQSAAYANRHR